MGRSCELRHLPGVGFLAGIVALGGLSPVMQGRLDGNADGFGGGREIQLIEGDASSHSEGTGLRVLGDDQRRRSALRPYGVLTGEFVANLGGGIRTGSVWEGLFDFGIDITLSGPMSESVAMIHLGALAISGNPPAENLVGSFNAASNIAAFDTLRLFQAWWQKEWREGALAIRIGQLTLDDHFMVSERAALFVNSVFGPLPTESGNLDAPIFPMGAPGIWGSIGKAERSQFRFGIYSGDAGEEAINDHGLEFGLGGSRGYAVFLEAGFEREIGGMPGRYKIGGFYHTGDFEDFDSGARITGNSSFYFVGDQALFSELDSNQGLSSFLRFGFAPRRERNRVTSYCDIGLTYWGLLPNRDSDLLGLAYSSTQFGDAFLRSAAATGRRAKAERVLEVTYEAALNPWITLQPDLQVILDPHDGPNDVLLVGMRVKAVY